MTNTTSDRSKQAQVSPDTLSLRRLQSDVQLDTARILRTIEKRVNALFVEQGHDVTAAQGNALAILFVAKRPLTAAQLADAMSVSQVTIHRFVSQLEERGWIKRQRAAADKRAMLIRPTDKAYASLPAMIQISNTVLDEVFAGFSREDVEQLAALTRRVRDNL